MHGLSRKTWIVVFALLTTAALSGVLAMAGKPGGGTLPPVGPATGVIYFWDVGLDPIIGAPGWPCKINPDGTGYQILAKEKGLGKSAARDDWDVSHTSTPRFFVYRDQVTHRGVITVASEEGTIERPLLSESGEQILGLSLAISPDDRHLAYRADGNLYVADLIYDPIDPNDPIDGIPYQLGNSVLANVPSGGYYTWSPDGAQIAFGSGDIFVVTLTFDKDGTVSGTSTVQNITNSPDVNDWAPAWSPWLSNGMSRIAYGRALRDSGSNGEFPIQTRLPDGSGLVVAVGRVNSGVSYHGFPSWSPDGTQIAFLAVGGGNRQTQALMRSAADGTTTAFNLTGFSREMQICRVHWRP